MQVWMVVGDEEGRRLMRGLEGRSLILLHKIVRILYFSFKKKKGKKEKEAKREANEWKKKSKDEEILRENGCRSGNEEKYRTIYLWATISLPLTPMPCWESLKRRSLNKRGCGRITYSIGFYLYILPKHAFSCHCSALHLTPLKHSSINFQQFTSLIFCTLIVLFSHSFTAVFLP